MTTLPNFTFVEKTYAVRDLMEWRLMLPTGHEEKPYIEVAFEGGQITGYGVAPATFTTRDPFTQSLIESNPWFKAGRIYLKDQPKNKSTKK